MANKINSMSQSHLQVAGQSAKKGVHGKSPEAPESAARTGETAAKVDTVELTDFARSLQALEELVAGASEVDQSRVDAVRSRIEAGDYEVSSERVAQKMLVLDRSLPDDK